jgi:hypothetical protein
MGLSVAARYQDVGSSERAYHRVTQDLGKRNLQALGIPFLFRPLLVRGGGRGGGRPARDFVPLAEILARRGQRSRDRTHDELLVVRARSQNDGEIRGAFRKPWRQPSPDPNLTLGAILPRQGRSPPTQISRSGGTADATVSNTRPFGTGLRGRSDLTLTTLRVGPHGQAAGPRRVHPPAPRWPLGSPHLDRRQADLAVWDHPRRGRGEAQGTPGWGAAAPVFSGSNILGHLGDTVARGT